MRVSVDFDAEEIIQSSEMLVGAVRNYLSGPKRGDERHINEGQLRIALENCNGKLGDLRRIQHLASLNGGK